MGTVTLIWRRPPLIKEGYSIQEQKMEVESLVNGTGMLSIIESTFGRASS